MLEINDGTPALMTMTFMDETVTPPVLADPASAALNIRVGYGVSPTVVPLASWTHVSTGVYTYEFSTLGLTTATGKEVECVAQVHATGGIQATSDPGRFTVVPAVV